MTSSELYFNFKTPDWFHTNLKKVCKFYISFLSFSQKVYSRSDLSELSIYNEYSDNCIVATGDSDRVEVYQCQSLQSDKDRHGICQYTACTAMDGKECIFPFKLVLQKSTKCIINICICPPQCIPMSSLL